jgi:8-oxo-dGTP pyrophosphatase MutT (NUDIX family)
MSHPGTPPPWQVRRSRPGPDLLIAQARFDVLENPRTGAEHERVVLACPTWVNVVALTPERRLVVVRQFRFGTRKVTTEIPGGVVDAGETPAATASRELREETGHTAERWSSLGTTEPNPAFQDNLCHHFLAEGARATHELELDPGEDIEVASLSEPELLAAIAAGEIRHSLVLCALARIFDLRAAFRSRRDSVQG